MKDIKLVAALDMRAATERITYDKHFDQNTHGFP